MTYAFAEIDQIKRNFDLVDKLKLRVDIIDTKNQNNHDEIKEISARIPPSAQKTGLELELLKRDFENCKRDWTFMLGDHDKNIR